MVIGRLKLPMELCCGSDEAAFASKLAVCLITSTPPLTGLKPAYDENCLGIKEHKQHNRLSRRYGRSFGRRILCPRGNFTRCCK